MSIRRDLALSLILGLRNVHAVLCHLFRCFDPRFKENIHSHPVFIIRDINSCRKGYLKDRLKSRERDHFNIQFVIPSQIAICRGSKISSKLMFSRFTEVLTVAMVTSELRARVGGILLRGIILHWHRCSLRVF